MPRATITGATGLVGANLAAALLARGVDVRCTRRTTSKIAHLSDLPIAWVEADLSDTEALTRAFEAADVVFHCAAAVSVKREVTPLLQAANVEGTRHVLQAVRAAGAGRLVHCSTVGAVGLSADGHPCDESSPWNFADYGMDDGYVTTKRQAEDLVRAAAETGLDAVIVNPTYMLGPYDQRPSSGKMIIEIINRSVPGYSSGKNNFVDVRDVCRGMIAAWEKGRPGERYILGGQNLSYRDFFAAVSRIAGVKPLNLQIPRWIARASGWLGDLEESATGREALLNSNTVAWGYTDRFIFSSEKARRELGYAPGSFEEGVRAAIRWFRDHDMLDPTPEFP